MSAYFPFFWGGESGGRGWQERGPDNTVGISEYPCMLVSNQYRTDIPHCRISEAKLIILVQLNMFQMVILSSCPKCPSAQKAHVSEGRKVPGRFSMRLRRYTGGGFVHRVTLPPGISGYHLMAKRNRGRLNLSIIQFYCPTSSYLFCTFLAFAFLCDVAFAPSLFLP